MSSSTKNLLQVLALVFAVFITMCGREGPEDPPDMTAPAVRSSSPYYGEQDVPVNVVSITVTFNEAMNATTVNASTISLMTGTVPVPGSISCTGATAVFKPDTELAPNTNYRLEIVGVKDASGNLLAGPVILPFTTGTIVKTFTVTPSVQGNGSISPDAPFTVDYNEIVQFTVTPGSGQKAEVAGCGGSLSGNIYTTATITADCSVVAAFSDEPVTTHTVATRTEGGIGTIDPSGTLSVEHGNIVSFTVTPNEGYYLVAVTGCDISPVGAKYQTGPITGDCTVTAQFAINTYTIDAGADPNGTISPSGALTVNHGTYPAFTITPNEGFRISDVVVDGASQGAISSYTFDSVTANHSIFASFVLQPPATYTIVATAGPHGSINGSAGPITIPVTVMQGSTQSFKIRADLERGYFISDIMVDGTGVHVSSMTYEFTYDFVNVTDNHTISANFDTLWHVITASAEGSGEIIPAGDVLVADQTDQTFSIRPITTAYRISAVVVDSSSVGPVESYTFSTVTGTHSIHAIFEPNVYSITVINDDPNGAVSCEPLTVGYGGQSICSISPVDPNYYQADVVVDGISHGNINEYIFMNVSAGHTIRASFTPLAPRIFSITATATAGGTVSCDPPEVSSGADSHCTITLEENFHIVDVLVDGESVGVTDAYNFTAVTADHAIHAVFAENTPEI